MKHSNTTAPLTFDEIKQKYFLDGGNQQVCALWLHRALEASFNFLQNPERLKIHSDVTLPELEKIFSEVSAPEQGLGLEATFQEAVQLVMRHSVRLSNPYFIGHMTGSTPFFGLIVDLLTSAVNQNVVKIETALAASFVEGQTITWLHKIVYKKSESYYKSLLHKPNQTLGNVTNGGTLGNITALAVARNIKIPGCHTLGMFAAMQKSGFAGAVILASARVHYSIRKSAAILGIGAENVIEITCEQMSNRIDIDALVTKISELKKLNICVLALVGVAGSTETGSIDDLRAMSSIALQQDIWFHVDAAWGGAFLLSDKQAPLLDGIAEADSVTLDGHKLFYLPMSQGTVLFKKETHLDTLRHEARYIIRKGSVDLGRTSVEGSRRFDSFKLWFFLKTFGKAGYGTLLDRSVDLTTAMQSLVVESPCFQATSHAQTNIFTYRYVPIAWAKLTESNDSSSPDEMTFVHFANQYLNLLNIEIQKIQRQRGKSFVSRTTLESVFAGQEIVVFRVVLFNPLTTSEILSDILSEQSMLGEQLQKSVWKRIRKSCPIAFDNFLPVP